MRRLAWIAAIGVLWAGPAEASDPVGVYAYVDHVVFEPAGSDAATAQAMQVFGVFAVATGKPGDGDVYTSPRSGYMYYTCPAGQESTCKVEWQDIVSSVGTGECVGWGERYIYERNGSIRDPGGTPTSPDGYPIAMGVLRTTMQQCPLLKAHAMGTLDLAAPAPRDMGTGTGSDLAQPPTLSMPRGCSAAPARAAAGPASLAALVLLALLLRLRRK